MQINYPNARVRRATPGFWWAPTFENTLQAMDVPPVYAPYGTPGFWPNATVREIAPNSGQKTSVAASALKGLHGAVDTGHPLNPISLVAPMPSITPVPASVSDTPACNAVSAWASGNPLLAALAVVGTYLFLGGHK